MKQMILVREDLKMSPGKMSAQCSHASVEAVLKTSKEKINKWKQEGMKKVILKVKDKKELLHYNRLAKKEKLVSCLIKDAGKTFFKRATITCLAIGPDDEEKINKVTSTLKLL
ncbi:MAG: peptidyl-tRNA hydrolase [Nanoarchaeota archaeon]|nr:peptidyl-tRNA hydrolase [Nanoarchaeota archaeon]